jgi:hypothetical protein
MTGGMSQTAVAMPRQMAFRQGTRASLPTHHPPPTTGQRKVARKDKDERTNFVPILRIASGSVA